MTLFPAIAWLRGKYGYPAMFAAYNAGPERRDDFLARGKLLPGGNPVLCSGVGAILDKSGGSRRHGDQCR